MSLISEALKKAQAQQQGQPHATAVPAPSSASPSTQAPTPLSAPLPAPGPDASRSTNRPLVLLLIASLALAFMLGGGLIVWGLLNLTGAKQGETAAIEPIAKALDELASVTLAMPTEAAPEKAVSEATPPPASSDALAASTPTESAPITFKVKESLPPAPAPTQANPAPTTAQATPALPASVLPAPSPPPAATTQLAQPASAPPPVPSPAIRQRIAELEIRGIMRGGGKVLLFDPAMERSRAFSNQDLVDATLGIRIETIGSQELVFTDESGARYVKRF